MKGGSKTVIEGHSWIREGKRSTIIDKLLSTSSFHNNILLITTKDNTEVQVEIDNNTYLDFKDHNLNSMPLIELCPEVKLQEQGRLNHSLTPSKRSA